MFTDKDIINILLPVLSHWKIWGSFCIIVVIISFLYAYPRFKKPRKEFNTHYISIPITSIISLYIFAKMFEGVIYEGAIVKFDEWVNKIMIALHFPWLTKLAFVLTSVGNGIPIIIIVVITIGILLLRKRWRFALLSSIAILGATVLQIFIKSFIQRIRPLNSLETVSPGIFSASFPSGHAITAIVFVSLLVYSYKDDIKNTATEYLFITTASMFFITVGLTRIYLNAHWFSDVIAGMSLGLFWFMFVVLVERSITGLIPAIKVETKKAEPIIPVVSKE